MNNFYKRTIKKWTDLDQYDQQGWIFRGQKNKDWTFKTSIERLATNLELDKKYLSIIERSIVGEFKRRYHQYSTYLPEKNDNLEWLSIMRHHGSPTRLLDWSYSIYVALYHALENAFNDKGSIDSALWAMNAAWVNETGSKIMKKAKVASEDISRLKDGPPFREKDGVFTKVFLNRKRPITMVYPACPRRLTVRMTVQKGLFICPGELSKSFDDNLTAMPGYDEEKNLIKLIIQKENRLEFLNRLNNMNISRTSLFPGLDGFASSLSVFHHTYKLIKDSKIDQCNYIGSNGESVWEL
jgi:hypothetical protein